MTFNKIDDGGISQKTYEEEQDQEEVPVEVEHVEFKLHNQGGNQDEVIEEAQDTEANEELMMTTY